MQVRASSPEELENLEGTNFRVEMDSASQNIMAMTRMGYTFGDRTLGVTINLKKATVDYERLVRFSLRNGIEDDKKEIIRIAQVSFPTDRRFHVRPCLDQELADHILQEWIDRLSDPYVCMLKDKVIGFIDLETISDSEVSIHLAAVEERYRAAGAALSMYAYAITRAKENGFQKVLGRISSANTAVMNLYAYLGATFAQPLDVFLKEGAK